MKCRSCAKEYPSRHYFEIADICIDCASRLAPEEKARVIQEMQQKYSLTTTAFGIDGYRIVRSLGVVRGITVRSRSIFGTLGATLQTIIGGNITLFSELCENTRAKAFEMMFQHAERMGGNAVVGVRYDATAVIGGVNEVLCYGTAAVVEPTT